MAPRPVVVFLCLAAALGWLAWTLGVDYFDAYDILNNARRLVGNGVTAYVGHRGLLAGPLYSPLALVERLRPTFDFFRGAHLFAAGLTAATVLAVHRLARRTSPTLPWLPALAFAVTPLVVHYGPFAKEDMPATLFTVLGFTAYLESGVGAAPLCFAAAGLLRPNLIPAILLTLLLHRRERRGTLRLYGGWGLATVLGVWVVYRWAGLGTPADFVRDLITQWRDNRQGYQPPGSALLILSASLPIFAAVAAAWGALRARNSEGRLLVLWGTVFLSVQIFVVSGKEARYFLPVLPALYCLGAAAWERFPRWALALWWLCLPAGLFEAARFQDPLFREPRARRLAESAARLSRTGKVVWVGPFYPIFPEHHVLHEEDNYFSVFHLWRNSMAFHLKREVPAIAYPEADWVKGQRWPRNLGRFLVSGDAVLWNPEPKSYATGDLPQILSPLRLAQVRFPLGGTETPLPGPREIYEWRAQQWVSVGWQDSGEPARHQRWLQLSAATDPSSLEREYSPYTL